jgi:hypothetical protein
MKSTAVTWQSGRSLASARAIAPVPVPRSRIRHGLPAAAPAPVQPGIRYPDAGSALRGNEQRQRPEFALAHQMSHRLAALAAAQQRFQLRLRRVSAVSPKARYRSAPCRSRAQQDFGIPARAFTWLSRAIACVSHC